MKAILLALSLISVPKDVFHLDSKAPGVSLPSGCTRAPYSHFGGYMSAIGQVEGDRYMVLYEKDIKGERYQATFLRDGCHAQWQHVSAKQPKDPNEHTL